MKIEIRKTNNGYILQSDEGETVCETDNDDTHYDDACKKALYQLMSWMGKCGDKHSEKRIQVYDEYQDSYEKVCALIGEENTQKVYDIIFREK